MYAATFEETWAVHKCPGVRLPQIFVFTIGFGGRGVAWLARLG